MGRWYVIAVGLLCLVLSGLIYLTSDIRNRVSGPEAMLREVLAPMQYGLTSVSRWSTETFDTVRSLPGLRAENRDLRRTVALLEAQLFATRELRGENERLREMLELKPYLPARSVVARVVARPAEHWFSHVTINRGRSDGLEAGLPVVDTTGIIGQVESVTANTARVILLVDPKSAVGGVVVGTGEPVLVEGTGAPTGSEALVQPLVRDSRLNVGDEVVTSGLSRIFPKGLPIGRIVLLDTSRDGLQAQAVLKPHVDFTRLDWVSVILDSSEEILWPSSAPPGDSMPAEGVSDE